jgi:hypothetical protein
LVKEPRVAKVAFFRSFTAKLNMRKICHILKKLSSAVRGTRRGAAVNSVKKQKARWNSLLETQKTT